MPLRQRPPRFKLAPRHHLAQGLVFAGLGAHAGSSHYHDSSLHRHHGTLDSDMTASDWTYLNNRRALQFTAGTEYVSCSQHEDLQLASGVGSVFTRFQIPTGQDTYRSIVTYGYDPFVTGEFGWGLVTGNPANEIQSAISDGGSVAWLGNNSTVTIDVEATACITFDGTTFTQYVNGVYFDSVSSSIVPQEYSTYGLYIGNGGQGSRDWEGLISDVLIYHKRCLSAGEVAKLHGADVTYNGLILPPVRKGWPVTSGGAPAVNAPTGHIYGPLVGPLGGPI